MLLLACSQKAEVSNKFSSAGDKIRNILITTVKQRVEATPGEADESKVAIVTRW